MHTVDPVSHVARQVREVGVTHKIFDLDVLQGKLPNLGIDPLGSSVLIPTASCHLRSTPSTIPKTVGSIRPGFVTQSSLSKHQTSRCRSPNSTQAPPLLDGLFTNTLHMENTLITG